MKKLFYSILVIGIIASSCETIEDACGQEKVASALIFNFPDSLEAGETYPLKIQYVLDNSCGEFDEFEVNSVDHSYEVKLLTKYEGCNCNLEFVEGEAEFDIRIDWTGIYEFKFWLSDNDYDTYSLKVYN